jgi:hypothetical protein
MYLSSSIVKRTPERRGTVSMGFVGLSLRTSSCPRQSFRDHSPCSYSRQLIFACTSVLLSLLLVNVSFDSAHGQRLSCAFGLRISISVRLAEEPGNFRSR